MYVSVRLRLRLIRFGLIGFVWSGFGPNPFWLRLVCLGFGLIRFGLLRSLF